MMAHLLPLLIAAFQVHLLAAALQPTHEHPEPASILLNPVNSSGLNSSSSSSSSSSRATIPAFPEQSNVASAAAACSLDPPAELLPSISAGCAAPVAGGLPSRSRCCPALHAWVLAAYSSTALAARHLPAAASFDLPALPDDSESCIASAERELCRRGGPQLPRVNATCDVAYCFCGVRLRRLACAGAFSVDPEAGRWAPAGDAGRRLEKDCSRPGFGGCTRCLRTLNQLKAKHRQRSGSSKATARLDSKDSAAQGSWECQLMGLTWLLSRNRTRFLPAAAAVLQAILVSDDGADPTACSLSVDDSPLAVGSDLIDAHDGGGYAARPASLFLAQLVFLVLVGFALCHA